MSFFYDLGNLVGNTKRTIASKLFSSKSEEKAAAGEVAKPTLGIPIWFGWGINILAWGVFLVTMNHLLDIVLGLACCFAAFVGLKHRNQSLLYASILDAIWMFTWGLGFWDDWFGFGF